MNRWTEINNKIVSEKYDYISFDIFDTLLIRPFWEPTDIFFFLGVYAEKLNIVEKPIDFIQLRKNAEEEARLLQKSNSQDITLDEIYDFFKKTVANPINIKSLMHREIELELNFCYKRNCGYELYQKAINSGKKVICISDMYLNEKDICLLLNKNGFDKLKKVYISSEIRLGKYTGDLYQYVKKDLEINQNGKILHIGDNYKSDYLESKRNGLDAIYLPKTKDAYLKKNKNLNIGLLNERIKVALAANSQWDNPFIESYKNQDLDLYEKIFKEYKDVIESSNDIIYNKKISLINKFRTKILRNIKLWL